nr:hypothetical protein [Thermoanaerobaculaceae bacterium]
APHPDLVKAGRAIAAARQGTLRFSFTPAAGEPLELRATWRSAAAAGTAWRVVVVGENRGERSPLRTLDALGLPGAADALRALAGEQGVAEAFSRDDRRALLAALSRHYERYPCYALQWVTPRGFVVGGYPPGNALMLYQLDPFQNPADTFLLERVQAGTEAVVRVPLGEGLMAVVHLVPVHADDELVGFVYSVSID